jgi:phenylpropionate dioxygenase-like ring-hydroxylating dioxygenase large terminal subunit
VFDHPLVLWKSVDDGEIWCCDDICPHRSAALSEGRIRDGKIECLYHGWQFEGRKGTNNKAPVGSCTYIPQLEKGATIPKRACLKMREIRIVEGIVWVWMGDSEPSKDVPRQGDSLDEKTGIPSCKGTVLNDFLIDLPYDHSYLIENLIDPAHIPISHDNTQGGGKRDSAQAYDMQVDPNSISPAGFKGRYRTESSKQKNDPFIEVDFQAPGIIRQYGEPRPGIFFGAALHCRYCRFEYFLLRSSLVVSFCKLIIRA